MKTETHTTNDANSLTGETHQNPSKSGTKTKSEAELIDLALSALADILTGPAIDPAVRLRAAKAVLRSASTVAGSSETFLRAIRNTDRLHYDLAPHQALDQALHAR